MQLLKLDQGLNQSTTVCDDMRLAQNAKVRPVLDSEHCFLEGSASGLGCGQLRLVQARCAAMLCGLESVLGCSCLGWSVYDSRSGHLGSCDGNMRLSSGPPLVLEHECPGAEWCSCVHAQLIDYAQPLGVLAFSA